MKRLIGFLKIRQAKLIGENKRHSGQRIVDGMKQAEGPPTGGPSAEVRCFQVLLLESPANVPAKADEAGAEEQHGNWLGDRLD